MRYSIGDYKSLLTKAIEQAFNSLLTEKHLYQSVNIITPEIDEATTPPPGKRFTPEMELMAQSITALLKMSWEPEAMGSTLKYIQEPGFDRHMVMFKVLHTKIHCRACGVQPHNPIDDIMSDHLRTLKLMAGGFDSSTSQLFLIPFECQSCKGRPTTFLISREENKLTLVGRNPMEAVDVPPCIPKEKRAFFSDAIIAYQSGQILPGLFMFRTFVEQYAYFKHPDKTEFAVDAIDAYMECLPIEFRSHFPSLRNIYERLSIAIHKATPDDELFKRIEDELIQHFDGKKAYRIK